MENVCDICKTKFSEDIPLSGDDVLCSTCKQIVKINGQKKNINATEVKKALKAASFVDNNGEHHFLCYYTGIPCEIETGAIYDNASLSNAFDLTFDHLEPSYGHGIKGKELAVCLNVINQIKGNIPATNFKNVIIILGKHFASSDYSNYSPKFGKQFRDVLHKGFDQ
ncbi:MAG: hypothetical protein U9N13_08905 [Euryarchaeota archaeon]|nr:hypothetical protein [Euryarchaeota archaeon]